MDIQQLDAVDAMDRFNALIQAEIEITERRLPAVALELAQIKLKVNQWFVLRRELGLRVE